MATLIPCNTSDGRVHYVNLDNVIYLQATAEGGTAIQFVGNKFMLVVTPVDQFLGRKD